MYALAVYAPQQYRPLAVRDKRPPVSAGLRAATAGSRTALPTSRLERLSVENGSEGGGTRVHDARAAETPRGGLRGRCGDRWPASQQWRARCPTRRPGRCARLGNAPGSGPVLRGWAQGSAGAWRGGGLVRLGVAELRGTEQRWTRIRETVWKRRNGGGCSNAARFRRFSLAVK